MSLPAGLPDGLVASHRAWLEAVGGTDLDAYVGLVCHDVVWLPPGADPIAGRSAFREWLAPFFEAYEYEFAVEDPRFRVAGRWALERGRFVSRMTPRSGGEERTHGGRFVLLWRREDDGTWRIERFVDDS